MTALKDRSPRCWAADAGGNREHQYLTRPDGEPSRLVYDFVDNWENAAGHFLSAFFADTFEGHRIGVDIGLCRDDFTRQELWEVAELLGLCGLAGIRRPPLGLILLAADDTGRVLHGGNPFNLNWLAELEYCGAGLPAYAKELKRFARRKARAQELYRRMLVLLDGDTSAIEQPTITTTIRQRRRRAG